MNIHGIGAPVIFVRTGGCHLRCYAKTLGVLCDTPEALERGSGEELTTEQILERVNEVSKKSGGIKLICLSGGDPLWRGADEIADLMWAFGNAGYKVSVETSGTLSMRNYAQYSWVHWVLDYKLKSAGVKQKFVTSDLSILKDTDYIKFVIHDMDDYNEFHSVVEALFKQTQAKIAVGVYYNGVMKNTELIKLLTEDYLLGRVMVNFQVHKLATLYDGLDKDSIGKVEIPALI